MKLDKLYLGRRDGQGPCSLPYRHSANYDAAAHRPRLLLLVSRPDDQSRSKTDLQKNIKHRLSGVWLVHIILFTLPHFHTHPTRHYYNHSYQQFTLLLLSFHVHHRQLTFYQCHHNHTSIRVKVHLSTSLQPPHRPYLLPNSSHHPPLYSLVLLTLDSHWLIFPNPYLYCVASLLLYAVTLSGLLAPKFAKHMRWRACLELRELMLRSHVR
jgi:hypothetical protein